VAPERIERGIDYSLNEEDSRLLGNALSRGSVFINELYMRWDAINYNWSRWVLNYDSDRQEQLLSKWLGEITPLRVTFFVLGVGAIIVLILLVGLVWRPRRGHRHPADIQFLRFDRKLARVGLRRAKGEAPRVFAQRVINQYPELAEQVNLITQLYEWIRYSDCQIAISELTMAVNRFRPSRKS
jgi:hypothetical protein